MLETGIHQGMGLQGLAPQSAPRLVVMASHGDRDSELPLLWDLCAAWTDLGYTVVVLDATQAEMPHRPGLLQLMDPRNQAEDMPHDRQDMHWSIYPAAKGMRQLFAETGARTPAEPLGELEQLFQNYDVVLLYAPASMLALRLSSSGIEPLLAVSGTGRSVLTAYQALKLLLLNGQLQPTIVSTVHTADQHSKAIAHNLNKSLQDCAMNFLGRQITTLSVDVQPTDDPAARDANRLALRLLESNTAPTWDQSAPSWQTALDEHDHGKRSH